MIKIWITGHREEKFNDWDIKKEIINKYIIEFIETIQIFNDIEFSLGWANWVDNIVWLLCINNNIPYTLYLPFKDHSKQIEWWNSKQKKEYQKIIKNAKSIIYWKWYFHRNRLIVDNSDFIITWFLWNFRSWTWYTINYAKKNWKKVFNALTNKEI